MSKTVLIIIIVVIVLLMGMFGAGFFILWSKISQIPPPSASGELAVEEEQNTMGPLYDMSTMIVNLADKGGKRYLRVTMALELSDVEVQASIETKLPLIRDAILMILPTKKYDDINTTEGKIGLRNELIEKINEFMGEGKVKNIYFTEFVVQ